MKVRPIFVHVLIVVVFVTIFLVRAVGSFTYERPPRKDAWQYLTLAYNLRHHAAFSLQEEATQGELKPSAYREPGYPLLLALGISLTDDLEQAGLQDLKQESFQSRLWPVKHLQAFLLLVTSLLSLATVWLLTGNKWLSYGCLVLVGFNPALHYLIDRFYSENLVVFLFAAYTFGLVLAVKRPSTPRFAMVGILLGLLSLTRAACLYFWIPTLLLLVGAGWHRRDARARRLWQAAVCLGCFLLIASVWMTRNYYQLGRFFMSERGGIILNIRAETNMMTSAEYFASFPYWTNSRWARGSLLQDVDTQRLEPDSETSFIHVARQRRTELLIETGDRAKADEILRNEALGRILRHPLRHLLVTLPLAHRGIYIMPGNVYNLLLFGVFCAAFTLCWFRKDMPGLAALGPAAFAFAFHALLSDNLPRYNVFLIPSFILGAALLVSSILPGAGHSGSRP